jgi:flagellar biosynthesis regulator FlaF
VNRHQLARRVDELAAAHSGQEFADAVKELAATLDEYEKEELQRVLLERAASLDQAVMDRVDARGWFRRQWDRASGG